MSDHIRQDKRSLVLHRKIASKLLERPDLVEVARSNLVRWRGQNGEEAWMIEWMRILDLPIEDVVSFLCDQGEHATRLRQSSPFTGILTDQERLAIFEDQEFLAARPHNLNSGVTVWHTTIQDADDGSGDGILELPSDLLMQLGWKEGDLLTIEKMDSGELILRRAEKL